jgi:hypothetical protein
MMMTGSKILAILAGSTTALHGETAAKFGTPRSWKHRFLSRLQHIALIRD